MKPTLAAFVAALVLSTGADSLMAQDYPGRPVKLLVGFSAGGAPDLIGRAVAKGLSDVWGRPVVVENKAGAAGTLAADATAKAAPDGYTLFLGSDSAIVSAPFLQDKIPYDALSDFQPIALVAGFSLILVANPSLNVRTFAEFIETVKARPGAIDYASFGIGTSPHLAMEQLQRLAGIKLNHIPYKGSPPALQDLLAGRVLAIWNPVSSALPHIQAGKLIALAIGSAERLALLPNLPTVSELRFPGFEAGNWIGVMAPAKLSEAVLKKIESDLRVVTQSAPYRELLSAQGIEARTGTTEEFVKRVHADYNRNKALFSSLGISRN